MAAGLCTFAFKKRGMSNKRRLFRYLLPAAGLLLVGCVRGIPLLAEWYAQRAYPVISLTLSSFSRLLPFSLGDLFIYGSILGILLYPVYARRKKQPWKSILAHLAEYLAWVYIWFYLAWGLNYSQKGFYARTGIRPVPYSEEVFCSFLDNYTELLNASYAPGYTFDKQIAAREINRLYTTLPELPGIHRPGNEPRVKTMLLSGLIAKMGISGYMGPFFNEFNINGKVLPVQYPSTYAHELAHLLGITSEAEANFYSYLVCTSSPMPEIRFCGYFSVLGYVWNNAARLLEEEEFREAMGKVHPEIIALLLEKSEYWENLYSPLIGNLQAKIYDIYLKGNKISSGRKNYSEVIGLLISYYVHGTEQ